MTAKMNILYESSMEFLKTLSSMNLNSNQNAFYKWQCSKAKKINVISYKQIPEISKDIDHLLERNKFKIKECYMVATKCALACHAEYVEGLISFSGISIDSI